MTFPVTEEMVEAVCSHKFWITMISPPPVVHIDEAGKAWRKQIRECLEAALAVMPAPDDGEFERQLDSAIEYGVMIHEAENVAAMAGCGWSRAGDKLVADYESTRRTLLAMHAQARLAGLDDIRLDIHARGFNAGWREALEQLQESIIESSIKPENEFARGMQCADALVIQQIDIMLGGSYE